MNLAPADLPKEGPAYDLPIALGALVASEQIQHEWLDGAIAVGELSLDGSLRHVRGMLPMAALDRKQEFSRMFVPAMDAAEASLIPEVEVIPVDSLTQLVNHLSSVTPIDPFPKSKPETSSAQIDGGLQEIKGQEHAKRPLEVAAAGGHNVSWHGRQRGAFRLPIATLANGVRQ